VVAKARGVVEAVEAAKGAPVGINLARVQAATASAQNADTKNLTWLVNAALTRPAPSVGRR
jgi:hypothetical protein